MIPYSRNKTIVLSSSNRKDRMISMYMHTGKLDGLTDIAVSGDPNFGSSVNTNPVNLWYWHVAVAPLLNAMGYYCLVKVNITYYAKFYNKKSDYGMS